MNKHEKYLLSLDNARTNPTSIQLQTVKKVEALIKDLKKQTERLDKFVDVALVAVQKADKAQTDRKKEIDAFKQKQKELDALTSKMSDLIDDATNKTQVAKGHESANEGLEKRLAEASQALTQGAKNLGLPVPPILKSVGSAIVSSQGTRILVEDLNDYS